MDSLQHKGSLNGGAEPAESGLKRMLAVFTVSLLMIGAFFEMLRTDVYPDFEA